jgi:hypothetical protein
MIRPTELVSGAELTSHVSEIPDVLKNDDDHDDFLSWLEGDVSKDELNLGGEHFVERNAMNEPLSSELVSGIGEDTIKPISAFPRDSMGSTKEGKPSHFESTTKTLGVSEAVETANVIEATNSLVSAELFTPEPLILSDSSVPTAVALSELDITVTGHSQGVPGSDDVSLSTLLAVGEAFIRDQQASKAAQEEERMKKEAECHQQVSLLIAPALCAHCSQKIVEELKLSVPDVDLIRNLCLETGSVPVHLRGQVLVPLASFTNCDCHVFSQ